MTIFSAIFWLAAILVLLGFYFLPLLIAVKRKHHQGTAILVLNLFFGWTILGWIVALVWACTAVRPEQPG